MPETTHAQPWKARWLRFENPRGRDYQPRADHVASYYAATVDLPRYPTLRENVTCDVVVVGGGFSGIALARELAQSGIDVVLLEARRVGWGASGRNGGQVLPGLAKSTHEVRSKIGDQAADQLWAVADKGLRSIHQTIADLAIDCDFQRGHIYAAEKPRHERYLKAMLAEWHRLGYQHGSWLDRADLDKHLQTERYTGAIHDPQAGHFHPLKYLRALAQDAATKGVRIFEDTSATGIERRNGRVHIGTATNVVEARRAVIAGNAYLPDINPKIAPILHRETVSVASYVLVTKPVAPDQIAQIFPSRCAVADLNFVVNYFRPLPDNRILFGGGLNFGNSDGAVIEQALRRNMVRYLPSLVSAETDYFWGGHVSMARSYLPVLGHLDQDIIYVQGFSGHGINVTHGVAHEIASHLMGRPNRFDFLSSLKRSLFPGGHWLQAPLVLLGSAYAKIIDSF